MHKLKVLIFEILIIAAAFIFLAARPFRALWADAAVFVVLAAILVAVSVLWKERTTDFKAKYDSLEKEYNQLNKEVEVASSQVMSVSEQLYVTLEENNAFAQQLFAETREMTAMNTEANEKTEGVIGGVHEIMELLQHARSIIVGMEEKNKSTDADIKAGFDEILGIVEAINDIRAASEMAQNNINRLEKTSSEIMMILDTVKSISSQTQLLSLNASIESARAGEAGKGFAVVAGEIQKLSIETGNAVKDIAELVNSIGQQVGSVKNVIEENARRVEVGVNISGVVEKNIQAIDSAFLGISSTINEICGISGKEEELAQSLDGMLSVMERNTKSTSERVEEVYNSVHKQKHNIQDLAKLGIRLNDASGNMQELVKVTSSGATDRSKVNAAVESVRKMTGELNTKLLAAMDGESHNKILSELLKTNDFAEAAWTNDIKGRFICSIPEAGIANAQIREWFKKSVTGEEYISPVYTSAITRKPCVTYSIPIKDFQGQIKGVFGVDLKL